MLREERRSQLAITFLHYNILTSWRCEEGGERQQGDAFSQDSPWGEMWGGSREGADYSAATVFHSRQVLPPAQSSNTNFSVKQKQMRAVSR